MITIGQMNQKMKVFNGVRTNQSPEGLTPRPVFPYQLRQALPPHRQPVPPHRPPVPAHRQAVPAHRQAVRAHRQAVPAHRQVLLMEVKIN